MDTYRFGQTTFNSMVWIGNGRTFDKVRLVEVDKTSGGSFKFEVVEGNSDNILASSSIRTASGWSTFDFDGGEIVFQGSNYRLRLVKVSGGAVQVRGGAVHFRP